jgi:hypothetical protein
VKITSRHSALVLVAAAVLVASCARNNGKSGAASAESHAPGTTAAAIAGACSAYPKGSPGVINTFCDGPAVVKLTVGDKDYTLRGGACSAQGALFSLNLGVVAGPDLAGPKPDYVGLTAPSPAGPFTNAVLVVVIDGKTYSVLSNTGEVGPSGGHFEGAAQSGEVKVSGTFTC